MASSTPTSGLQVPVDTPLIPHEGDSTADAIDRSLARDLASLGA